MCIAARHPAAETSGSQVTPFVLTVEPAVTLVGDVTLFGV